EIEEIAGLDGGVDRARGPDLVVVRVEYQIDVEPDLLEPVLVDQEELGFDVDLHRTDFTQLGEQPRDLPVILRRVPDDERAVEFLDGARLAPVVGPALLIDRVGDNRLDLVDALLAPLADLFGCLDVVLLGVVEGALATAAAVLALLQKALQIDLG